MTTYRRNGSLQKGIEIVRFLADQRMPVSGRDVATALDMPHGTAMGYLVTLEDLGMVGKIGDHYELGMGAAMLWAKYKARKETEKRRIEQDLAALEGDNG